MYDLLEDNIVNVQNITLEVEGYQNILEINYGFSRVSRQNYLVWNVVGTEHVFKIILKEATKYVGNDYKQHFKDVLIKFRKDLLFWNKKYNLDNINNKGTDWMNKYWKQFNNLIIKE